MTLFALGFRPFFLFSALASLGLMLSWLLVLTTGLSLPGVLDPVAWHRHEMLFGYAGGVIAGFLLTAVRNWTGKPTLSGKPLAVLVAVWLLARILPFIVSQPLIYAALDVLFWAGLFAGLWQALSDTVLRNKVFLVLVALLGAAATLSHWHLVQPEFSQLSYLGSYLGLDLILVIMLVMGGRVIPFFIQRGLMQPEQKRLAWLETGVPFFLVAMLLGNNFLYASQLFSSQPLLSKQLPAVINIALAVWLAPNLWAWHQAKIWHNSLLWSLYLAYAWLVVGIFLRGLGILGLIETYMGIHAITVGGLGLLTLSMMSRVSLGHTGRSLLAPKIINLALILMVLAAITRVFLTSFMGAGSYHLAISLWVLALGIFVYVYTPILSKPRPDGRPG